MPRLWIKRVRTAAPELRRATYQYRALLAVDIVGFGRRDDAVQVYLRKSLYEILERAFNDVGVPWGRCRRDDRGDGVLVVLPEEFSTGHVVDPLFTHLWAGLRRYNNLASDAARIRLRMAGHTGPIRPDKHGLGGLAVIHLFRLLDAPGFKDAMADSPDSLGLIVSEGLYHSVIKHGEGLVDPAYYRLIQVELKEERCGAWLYLPSERVAGLPRAEGRL